jgi:hypothetical protein
MERAEPLRSCREDIPKEFPEILKDLTKEILLAQPRNTREIYDVAAGDDLFKRRQGFHHVVFTNLRKCSQCILMNAVFLYAGYFERKKRESMTMNGEVVSRAKDVFGLMVHYFFWKFLAR